MRKKAKDINVGDSVRIRDGGFLGNVIRVVLCQKSFIEWEVGKISFTFEDKTGWSFDDDFVDPEHEYEVEEKNENN